jgi:methanogenic corrinoid protein MtbC1
MADTILDEALQITPVPSSAALEYDKKREALLEYVNREMTARPDLAHLIGNNPVEVMHNNHSNHAQFMSNVFLLNEYELLARIVVWVYRSYHARGFSYDYFPIELDTWIRSIREHMIPDYAAPIIEVYRWMISHHDIFIELAAIEENPEDDRLDSSLKNSYHTFLNLLLHGDAREATTLAADIVKSPSDLALLFLEVIQPAMYRIGRLWEKGAITVADEHLASAIVARVLAVISMSMAPPSRSNGTAIVTAAPNEFHELGAWMVADMLKADSWNIKYLGANSPADDLLKLALQTKPAFVAISVTMPFNLYSAKNMINVLKSNPALEKTKILLGGGALNIMPDLWKHLGADGYAKNVRNAVDIAREWK